MPVKNNFERFFFYHQSIFRWLELSKIELNYVFTSFLHSTYNNRHIDLIKYFGQRYRKTDGLKLARIIELSRKTRRVDFLKMYQYIAFCKNSAGFEIHFPMLRPYLMHTAIGDKRESFQNAFIILSYDFLPHVQPIYQPFHPGSHQIVVCDL